MNNYLKKKKMNNDAIKITNLETLRLEKQRLKMYCSYQENKIHDKVTSIKDNYKQIVGETLLPFSTEANKKVSNVLDTINEYVFDKFLRMDLSGKNKLRGALIKIGQIGILRFFNNFRK